MQAAGPESEAPGPESEPDVPEPSVEDVIFDYLAELPGWHARTEIVCGTGLHLTQARWQSAITTLIDGSYVERRGERRGSRYRVCLPSEERIVGPESKAAIPELDAEPSVEDVVFDWLAEFPGWHSHAEIVYGTGLDLGPARWQSAINTLFDDGDVERRDGRRGARYRVCLPLAEWIVEWLDADPGWHTRAEIVDGAEFSFGGGQWQSVIKELLDAGDVERQGERRGTRYRRRTRAL